MQEQQETAILLTLLAYKICLVGIGLFYQKKTHDDVDFYLGGRRLGPLVAAISASASSSSAWTLLGVSGAAYAWGLGALWLFPGCVGGFLLNWYVLAPRLQRRASLTGALTVTDLLAQTDGVDPAWEGRIRTVASLIILLSLGTYIASQFQGAGKTFTETFDISLPTSILLGAAIVLLYTMLGGFWAVSVTDTLQGLVMVATSLLLPFAAVIAVGGPMALYQSLGEIADPSYFSLTRNFAAASGVGFILGILGIGLGYPGQPHVVNRFMALAEKPGSIRRARRIAVAWAVVVYAGMLLVGLCGRVLHPGLEDPEVVFISLTGELFHPIVAGIVLAAVLSAIMSTADSQLLVASSTISHDLKIGSSWGLSAVARSRIVVLLLTGAAVLGALLGSQEIFSQVLFAWAAMGCAFGPLLLVLCRRGSMAGSWQFGSIVSGFLLSVFSFYFFSLENAWKGSLERVFPFLIALTIAWLGWRRSRRPGLRAPSPSPVSEE